MNKQIEEKDRSICETCLHYYECWQADEETVACSRYLDDKEWHKTSDIARCIFDEIYAAYDDCIHIDEREIGHLNVNKFLECLVNIDKKYTESEGADA